MARKTQPTLFKLVCKRAALMRAPYHSSSWTSKTNQTTKKAILVDKTSEIVRSIKNNSMNNGKNKVINSVVGMYYR